jgi:predicted  nucleic acid-binding Zn-ribbon protein
MSNHLAQLDQFANELDAEVKEATARLCPQPVQPVRAAPKLTTMDFQCASVQQAATRAEIDLRRLQSNLDSETANLRRVNRQVVDVLGNLKKAEAVQSRACSSVAVRKVALFKDELSDVQRREAVTQRLVDALNAQIKELLECASGYGCTNGELIEGLRQFEAVEREVNAL